ncbi:MAG: YebC/PmpR family DNA-binding transcriptional regulator [Flavobacteriales bacterium TMED84]|nr:MAG: YebC/PmpR family DNA-binding transcriptional regulator [Flavobacteriales bacterium TMED84]|tara:strand:- start:709 stop:1455 length:747 start_codon:yes stop_codon:yes gene_type:complete
MAGHSKWANIKHRKGAQDAKRSKIFTKLIKELTIAAKVGGDDKDSNPRLRTAIQNAKGANMPKDTINRAIKKGMSNEAENYTEVSFEGYGPSGIAFFIDCSTDNNNRTVSNVRAIFNKFGGELGTKGSLEFIFNRKGLFIIEKNKINSNIDEFQINLIDWGLDDFIIDEDLCFLYVEMKDFNKMQKKLDEDNVFVKSSELIRLPNSTKNLEFEKAQSIIKMIEKFEEDDDVQNVFHNLEITEEIIRKI